MIKILVLSFIINLTCVLVHFAALLWSIIYVVPRSYDDDNGPQSIFIIQAAASKFECEKYSSTSYSNASS